MQNRTFAGNFAPAGWALCHGLCGHGDAALLDRLRQRIARPVTPAGTYQITVTAASATVQAGAPNDFECAVEPRVNF